MKNTFFAANRKTKQATLITGFSHWELVQNAFCWGIMMPNGVAADAIGRCASPAEFVKKALHSGFTVITENGETL